MKKTTFLLVFVLLTGLTTFSQLAGKIKSEKDSGKKTDPVDFSIIEERPEFPGGDAALVNFIAQNTKYPQKAKDKGIEGKVFVKFVINKKGKVTRVKVSKGVNRWLDSEAVRVVKLLPDWTPGKQEGEEVAVYFVVPINFKLY